MQRIYVPGSASYSSVPSILLPPWCHRFLSQSPSELLVLPCLWRLHLKGTLCLLPNLISVKRVQEKRLSRRKKRYSRSRDAWQSWCQVGVALYSFRRGSIHPEETAEAPFSTLSPDGSLPLKIALHLSLRYSFGTCVSGRAIVPLLLLESCALKVKRRRRRR